MENNKKIKFIFGTTCHLGSVFKDFIPLKSNFEIIGANICNASLSNSPKLYTSVWTVKEVIKEILLEAL